MLISSAAKAHEIGKQLALKASSNPSADIYAQLAPILTERTPFRFLDLIGEGLADCPAAKLDLIQNEIAAHATIGGWTVIASALRACLKVDLAGTLSKTHAFIIRADVWYACDCFGERVLGQAMVEQFQAALRLLSSWRSDENRWVRRSAGVAGHLWAKRTKGAEEYHLQAAELLNFYKPMLEERQLDAAKGVGWALKTLGRYYPDSLIKFFNENRNTCITAVINRKALKFLPEEKKAQLMR
jgi:3-methyladenine DNA glycosylase AlkD